MTPVPLPAVPLFSAHIAAEAVLEAAVSQSGDAELWLHLQVLDTPAGCWDWHRAPVGLTVDVYHHLGVVAVSSAGTADDHIHQGLEDLKGLTGLDGYGYGNKSPEGGERSHGPTRRDPHGTGRFIAGHDATRFWTKVHKIPGGCWLWTGATSSDGYGRFRITTAPGRHRHVKAHRWAYEHLVGAIPPGWTLDHLVAPGPCTSRACVRPDHLEAVTRAENARRAARRRRALPQPAEGPSRGRNPR